jgi:hypothetical protein
MSGHKYKIGQLVDYLGRERASGVYQITQLLPPEGEAFQYRIKNVTEPHERVAKESELRSAWPSAPELRHAFIRLQRPGWTVPGKAREGLSHKVPAVRDSGW